MVMVWFNSRIKRLKLKGEKKNFKPAEKNNNNKTEKGYLLNGVIDNFLLKKTKKIKLAMVVVVLILSFESRIETRTKIRIDRF